MPHKTYVCNIKLLFYSKNIEPKQMESHMIILNANKLLQELSELEEAINIFEEVVKEQQIDIDVEELLQQVFKKSKFV
jgi:hypothetical protein